jgi:hypothetical protein
LNVILSADADQVLGELEGDAKNEELLQTIWDVIEFIAEHSASAEARRRLLRTPGGQSVWLVPILVDHDGEQWVLLWQLRGDDVLIPYVGPDDFRSSK